MSMPTLVVVEQAHPENALPATARGYARDTITLGWDDRLRVRGQRRSDGGIVFGLSLPRGTTLRGGDCLVLHEVNTVVVVIEWPEPVFLSEPRTPQKWGVVCVSHRQSAPAAHDHRHRNRLPRCRRRRTAPRTAAHSVFAHHAAVHAGHLGGEPS